MASLLDTVKQNTSALASPTGPQAAATGLQPTGGESTAAIQSLTSVAQTGKDLGPSTGGGQARLSALGEKLAAVNTLAGAQTIQQQGAIQNTALSQQSEAQQQQYVGQVQEVTQQRVAAQQSFNDKTQDLLTQHQGQMSKLESQDMRSRTEQMGFMMRLSNDKYVTQLHDESTRSRLDEGTNFQEALTRTVFAQESDMFNSDLTFRNLMRADQRTFTQQMGDIDIDWALRFAQADNKAAATTMMWSGIGSLASAGAKAGYEVGRQPQEPDDEGEDDGV